MQRLTSILFSLLLATRLFAQAPEPAHNLDYWAQDLKSRITLGGFIQAGYTATDLDGTRTNTLDMKRAIVYARARVTDRWSFFFMHDFGSQVQEFYTDFRITQGKQMNIRIGQFKNQLSLENPVIPTILELIDICSQSVTYYAGCGSDPLFGINYGRDLGIDLYGELMNGKLLYNIELMNGSGVNVRDRDNKKNLIVKLEYRPMPGLRLVTSAQKGYGTSLVGSSVYIPEENTIAVGETYRRDRWTVGAEYKAGQNDYWKNRCFSVRGELLGGRDGKTNSYGGYVTASIPLKGCLDAIASYDYMDYAKGFDGKQRTQLVFGLQYWFYTRCRVQLQYTWSDTSTLGLNTAWLDKSTNRLQFQTQISF